MTDYFTRLAETFVGTGPTIRPLLTSTSKSVESALMPETEVSLPVPETEDYLPAKTAAQTGRPAELSDREVLPPADTDEAPAKTPPARTPDLRSLVQRTLHERPMSESHLPDPFYANPPISSPDVRPPEEALEADIHSSSMSLPAPSEILADSPREKPARSRAKEIDSGIREPLSSPAKAAGPNAQTADTFDENSSQAPALKSEVALNALAEDKSVPLAAERRTTTHPQITNHSEPRTHRADNLSRDSPFAFTLGDDNFEKHAPVVRVTIGRIEVRAITPEPPKRKPPAPAAPKLSLDQFLRQHNGRQQ